LGIDRIFTSSIAVVIVDVVVIVAPVTPTGMRNTEAEPE
jgi:hypothetical protein